MANFNRVVSISSLVGSFTLTMLAITLRIHQRINMRWQAIARALLRQPKILIFDEAVVLGKTKINQAESRNSNNVNKVE